MNKNHIKHPGELSIKLIPEIISKENPKNILLVKGQKSFNLIEPLLSGLIDSNCSTFTVKESNISLEHSLSGLKTYLNHKCDLIIAIGGGSFTHQCDEGLDQFFLNQSNKKNLN